MKIRNGFVSNSSSSSFILKLPKIETRNDLKKVLFGDNCPTFVTDWDGDSYATGQILDIVYKDIRDAMKNNNISSDENSVKNGILVHEYTLHDYDELIKPQYTNDYNDLKEEYTLQLDIVNDIKYTNDYKKIPGKDRILLFKKDRIVLDEIGDKMKDIIIKSISGDKDDGVMYLTLDYSDNDGEVNSFIEHGGVLDPITVTRINNH